MRDLAIRVEGLSKQYRIGRRREQHDTLRDTLTDAVATPLRRAAKLIRGEATGPVEQDQTIWALNDLSLEIYEGEAIGIIGRNGAGKSTLLKILSRITEPTKGSADVYGRVGSLLEVGTGFHPELTGRENVYLNGAILGMTRSEIDAKFDGIVAFAEVERFIDTPVKHYSSGMYLRLAFAVAAHLEPEILLVDEVLAVGDAAFQKKCLGKMSEVGQQGRTVLFVSHNMNAIAALCERCIWIHDGRLKRIGPTAEIIQAYLRGDEINLAERVWTDLATAPGDEYIRLTRVAALDEHGAVASLVDIRRPIDLVVEYMVLETTAVHTLLRLTNDAGVDILATADNHIPEWRDGVREPGRYRSVCHLPGNLLAEGRHLVTVALTDATFRLKRAHGSAEHAIAFDVYDPMDGTSVRGSRTAGVWPGVVRPMLQWSSELVAGPLD
jgi:lipopolysaccharide transport system ATP-binding protein